jgi:hypothetical protein
MKGISGKILLGLIFRAPYKRIHEKGRALFGGTLGDRGMKKEEKENLIAMEEASLEAILLQPLDTFSQEPHIKEDTREDMHFWRHT